MYVERFRDEALLCMIYKFVYDLRSDDRFAIALQALNPLVGAVHDHAFCTPENFLETRGTLIHRVDLDSHVVQRFINRLNVICMAYDVVVE